MTSHRKQRILEIVPGTLVWVTLLGVITLSIFKPLAAIYFIIAFDVYWFLRIMYMMIYMLISWRRYRVSLKVDWFYKLKQLEKPWREYYHLVILPTYQEPYSIIQKSFESLLGNNYPADRLIVVLAGEKRDQENFDRVAKRAEEEFGPKFGKFLITRHELQADEMPGKGSNINYAGHKAKNLIDDLGIEYEKIIVSTFDIDSRPHPNYFAGLTYQYLTHDNPTRTSFQPVAVYVNNVWESNAIVRVVASSTTFWLMTDMSRPERLFTFSSHSMSFRALVDVGFWDKTIVTEDSRIFLQCLIHYDGDYRVTPLYLPVYMNTVEVGHLGRSLKNQYKQMRRWAWGVEHFPYLVKEFWGKNGNKNIPFFQKMRYLWNQTEGVYSWATAPIIVLVVGYLPIWLASNVERTTVLFQNAPPVLALLMRVGMISLVSMAIIYSIMLPPLPKGAKWYQRPAMILQWVLSPITLVLFGSIPATDAQTRLMLGGKFRLGFWVTEKK